MSSDLTHILATELADFDKSWRVKDLQLIYAEHKDSPDFSQVLVTQYSNFPHTRHACLYMMKELVKFTKKLYPEFKVILPEWTDEQYWPSVIYTLDIVPFMDLTAEEWLAKQPVLERGLSHPNGFTRAFYYTAYHVFTQQHPSYLDDFLTLCRYEVETESKAVKGRILRVLKAHS